MAAAHPFPATLPLGISPFTFADLFAPQRLQALDQAFLATLSQADAALGQSFAQYRGGAAFTPLDESNLLVATAAHLGPFIAKLFAVEAECAQAVQHSEAQQVIFAFKREFVGKRLRKRQRAASAAKQAPAPLSAADQRRYRHLEDLLAPLGASEPPQGAAATASAPAPVEDPEMRAAQTAMALLGLQSVLDQRPAASAEALHAAHAQLGSVLRSLEELPGGPADSEATTDFAEQQLGALRKLIDLCERFNLQNMQQATWVSYHTPRSIDAQHAHLVEAQRPRADRPEALQGPGNSRRVRQGFALTDTRQDVRHDLAEVDYCLYCHGRGKDSCRHGLRDRAGQVQRDALGTPLEGCPLDERISEAHTVYRRGDAIAALAIICIDNPMCPGTGHRICNDCMKACIFQKQEPVNIPQVETGILTQVLALPYGFEIYGLLTRFNPLNRSRPYALPYRGYNVLVTGLGPAGYTLAHYLLNEGFGVVGIDALKIEPLPSHLTGTPTCLPQPLRNYTDLEESLAQRPSYGFGGVAEYGITVRWDKNFLKVIYLTLARRATFHFYGGIRLGGTLTLEDAWEAGFHHVAMAAGAGKPTVVNMKNNLLRGMRAASDFLMALQSSGSFRRDSLANLQVELPALVIGGGLTAIDTATELLAYYPVQVERLLCRVEKLGELRVLSQYDAEERSIAERLLQHARLLRLEVQKPQPDVQGLLNSFGGVSVVYRRSLMESPAYRLNHEEVQKGLEEGIEFVENLTPVEAVPDAHQHVQALQFVRPDGSAVSLPARCVMMAAGTSPNIVYEREFPGSFALDGRGRFFAAHRAERLADGQVALHKSAENDGFFTSYCHSVPPTAADSAPGLPQRLVSFYGDNHPRYAGNVVKAMASAKHGHTQVAALFTDLPDRTPGVNFQKFTLALDDLWLAQVTEVNRLAPSIIELVVRAPMQARKFEPGQFYRLQNYAATAPSINGQKMVMEGLALTGAWVDKGRGLLSMIALEMGASSRLCALLKPGDPVVVMGPTGTPTDIPSRQNVILCGGGLGNAVLFSVARAMQERHNNVVYFAGYRTAADLFRREEIESSANQVIWSVDKGPAIVPQRPQDIGFVGNIVQAMQAYAQGSIGPPVVPFAAIDRILAIGSDRMMAAVTRARKTVLKGHLPESHLALASINSPMQCMMKEVCAQCLQRHVDPQTGEESFVFSCFNQDQEVDRMDWQHLAARLRQNTVQEKLSNLYMTDLLQAAAEP
jgi:NADPH-dependent glutamate synthase beta subunit-like oxidoreductase/NAD(P)H-flavin reductase